MLTYFKGLLSRVRQFLPQAAPRTTTGPRVRLAVEPLDHRCVPAVFHVTGQAALSRAIRVANSNAQSDVIEVQSHIALSRAPLPVFTGDGGKAVVLDGNGFTLRRTGTEGFRILHNDGAKLTVKDLTVTRGIATQAGGGGILNQAGHLTLRRVTVIRNRAIGNTVGGGLYNEPGAVLTIRESTVARNHSATFGGGLRNQGLVRLIDRSTFADNHAAGDGGGAICNFFGGQIDLIVNSTLSGNSAIRGGGICNHGHVSLVNCTIVGNSAQLTGGGIENDHIVPLLVNSIVAGNINGQIFPNAPQFAANNVISDADPLVAPLANNGGPTRTRALLPGSPAIGAGSPLFAPPIDQRGFPRPPGGPIDAGAFQRQ